MCRLPVGIIPPFSKNEPRRRPNVEPVVVLPAKSRGQAIRWSRDHSFAIAIGGAGLSLPQFVEILAGFVHFSQHPVGYNHLCRSFKPRHIPVIIEIKAFVIPPAGPVVVLRIGNGSPCPFVGTEG